MGHEFIIFTRRVQCTILAILMPGFARCYLRNHGSCHECWARIHMQSPYCLCSDICARFHAATHYLSIHNISLTNVLRGV